MEEEKDVKVQKVVEEPRLSLGQFASFCVKRTEKGKQIIILNGKYSGGYIPKFYDRANKFVWKLLSLNAYDNELYVSEIERYANVLKKEAKEYPINKDDFRNREYSAKGLLELAKRFSMLSPILDKHIIQLPAGKSKANPNTIVIEGVKISTKVSLLLSEDGGLSQAGFVSFNFTKAELKREEAEFRLYLLWKYHSLKGEKFKLDKCFLIDVYAGKVYTAIDERFMEEPTNKFCRDIMERWKNA